MRWIRTVVVLSFCAALASPAAGQEAELGYLLRVEGQLAFIDRGGQHQVHAGDLFQLVREESIVHPVTGENLGGQVPLGVVRVVEVFPRLSTAEVIDLVRGTDVDTLNAEAKRGLIRIRPVPPEVEEALRTQPEKAWEEKPERGPTAYNPDGPIGALVPGLQVRFGSRALTALPDSIQKLIPVPRRGLAVPDSMDQGMRTADLQAGLLIPLSASFSVVADVRMGNTSLLAWGLRIYPKALLGAGEGGGNPDGRIGEPVLTLMGGTGGRGPKFDSLRVQGVSARIFADSDSVRKLVLAVAPAATDSAVQAAVNDSTAALRAVAGDSLRRIAKHGAGLAVEVALPVSRRVTFRAGLMRVGNIEEVSGGLTFYMKAVPPGEEGACPDGALRSPVFSFKGAYDTGLKKTTLDLDLRYPVSPRFTVSAGLLTDMEKVVRFGISLTGYLKLF